MTWLPLKTAALLILSLGATMSAHAVIPSGLKYKTFYDTTKIRFDKLMWFEEIPGKKGNFLVAEQNGKVWTLNAGAGTKNLFMDFPTFANAGYHEDGLLGLAFHPKFLENRKMYAFFTPGNNRTLLAIGEFSADATFLKSTDVPVKILWSAPISGAHNGATLQFGPDGFLYWAVGQDHGQVGTAQNMSSPRGKMYRINVDEAGVGGKPYSIPADNPYVNVADVAAKEIWAHGLRNPLKFSFDKVTGDLWAVEVGQWLQEDVHIIRKGENLGWDLMEGSNCYTWSNVHSTTTTCNKTNLTPPVWAIPHLDPENPWLNSGTGGLVYRANPASKFYGMYLFGDFCSNQMFALTQTDRKMTEVKELEKAPLGPIHFAMDADGKMYMAGWYASGEFVTSNGSSQILLIDHPELSLGVPTRVTENPGTRKKSMSRGAFVKLQGLPVGYYGEMDALGREHRTYSRTSASGNAR
ncbi:MAG: PQQ-dependent sugar dehydrogenase [Fibrobacterota bacterium]|nr:PQQ-dependent sugar dehydrogenase [Fibrobacterota bacterium]